MSHKAAYSFYNNNNVAGKQLKGSQFTNWSFQRLPMYL